MSRMMNKEELSGSVYEASSAEMQHIIMEWVKATEEFHHRYAQLTEVINGLQAGNRRQTMNDRTRLRRLIALRQQMSDVLMSLMLDMTGGRSGRSSQPSKPGQLSTHARLMAELNRTIDKELTKLPVVAQA